MKECLCGGRASYICQPCQAIVCNEHKIIHESGKQREHIFRELGRKLPTQLLGNILENLLSKISITNECKNQIIKESKRLLATIQSMTMHALDIIIEKQNHYENLLKMCQNSLFDNEINDIERESRTFLMVDVPHLKFKTIQKYYRYDFLKEFHKVNIEALTGQIITLNYTAFDSIGSIKTKIQVKEGIPRSQQTLIFAGEQLNDEMILANCNIQNEPTLLLTYWLRFYVQTMTGTIFKLDADPFDSIESVKAKIKDNQGIFLDQQILTYAGQRLEDRMTLADYKIQNESIIQLIFLSQIFVKTISGTIIALYVNLFDPIMILKREIQVKEGISSDRQRLLLAGEILEDRMALNDCAIKNESTIHLEYSFQVLVKILSNKTIALEVYSSDFVEKIKEKIQYKEGILIDRQRLILDGRTLEDKMTINDCNIKNESTLHLEYLMQILVTDLSNKTITLDVCSTDCINIIKCKIQDKNNIPPNLQKIIYSGKEMEGTKTLSDYNICTGSNLYLQIAKQPV